jgi:outer membrane protein OmpA-like peptidoglycan-associated protein
VTFATNQARLTPNAKQVLEIVGQSLKEHPDAHVEVAGYTDSTGSTTRNAKLSQARAQAVRAYLIQLGVPAEQVTAKGYGPANPIAPNDTPDGRAKNRRVELHRTD